jgi:hypothetical protein
MIFHDGGDGCDLGEGSDDGQPRKVVIWHPMIVLSRFDQPTDLDHPSGGWLPLPSQMSNYGELSENFSP